MAKKSNKTIDDFPISPKDILSSYDVIGMSSQEFGMYCRILFISWLQPKQCFLRYDEHNICELCNITPEEFKASSPKVLRKFKTKEVEGEVYIYNERLLSEYYTIIFEDKKTTGKQLSAKAELLNYKFDDFWDDYDKKVGDKNRILPKWLKLSDAERDLIRLDIPKRKAAQPNKKYRPNPESYINGKLWQNEIISYDKTSNQNIKANYNEQGNEPV